MRNSARRVSSRAAGRPDGTLDRFRPLWIHSLFITPVWAQLMTDFSFKIKRHGNQTGGQTERERWRQERVQGSNFLVAPGVLRLPNGNADGLLHNLDLYRPCYVHVQNIQCMLYCCSCQHCCCVCNRSVSDCTAKSTIIWSCPVCTGWVVSGTTCLDSGSPGSIPAHLDSYSLLIGTHPSRRRDSLTEAYLGR